MKLIRGIIVSFVAIIGGSNLSVDAFTTSSGAACVSSSVSTPVAAGLAACFRRRQRSPPLVLLRGEAEESGGGGATTTTTTTSVAESVLSEMHESGYPFRIVVVGNGAILETTSKLGPTMKSSVSPKTGGKLVTLASEDQSFEFHVKVDEVDRVVFVQSSRGEKTLRICRLVNGEGGSICSLILDEHGRDAIEWFSGMEQRYNEDSS